MTDILSSDILERQFGPTEIDVLHHLDEIRVIQTRALSTGQTLEISLVEFDSLGTREFEAAHQEILAGKSIGKTFRDHGIEFVRDQQAAEIRVLPPGFGKQFGNVQFATVVSVAIFVGANRLPYAEILETYSPEVIWPEASDQLSREQLSRLELLTKFIESI
ncbi:MAG: hypothetical protein AAB971_01515 [Patescibacteria group bacterium]|mgnify:FL=1